MRSAIHSLLIVSLAAGAMVGCVDETAPSAGLQATGQPLQQAGVYYLGATGTAESPAFTFYDQDKLAIGDGQVSQDPQQAEIRWQGRTWERTDGGFRESDAVIGSNGDGGGELATALTVFERSLDQAFPRAGGALERVEANSCGINVACRRPDFRCAGGCTGHVCSSTTPGVWGTCDGPRPTPPPTP